MQTYYYLCPAYTAEGQPEKAIDCVDKAVRLSPHDPSLYGLLMTKAGALETLGRDEEALDWVGRSLALSPTNPIALRHEIVLLEVLGRDDEARDAYRRYAALPGPQIRTIAELRARAMDAGASGPSPHLWMRCEKQACLKSERAKKGQSPVTETDFRRLLEMNPRGTARPLRAVKPISRS